ncbi:MAG TPA: hypothetical protein V6D06_01555 [Trichocoleus sp.]
MEAEPYVIKLQTHRNESLFGEVIDGRMALNAIGHIVSEEWLNAARSHRDVQLDQWVVMPTYIRGIVLLPALKKEAGHTSVISSTSAKPRLLTAFVAGFKAAAAKRINLQRNQPGLSVWQRSYSETLIPDETTLKRIRLQLCEQGELR